MLALMTSDTPRSWWREQMTPPDLFAAVAVALLAVTAVVAWSTRESVGDGTRSAVVTAALGGISTVVAYYLGERRASRSLARADDLAERSVDARVAAADALARFEAYAGRIRTTAHGIEGEEEDREP